MGPVPHRDYLIGPNTGKQLFNGAQQFEPPRPDGINAPGTFIGNAPIYNPLNRFGKKKIKSPTKSKTLNVSGKKAVNVKINIKQRNG
jgi:hypothetical protein